MRLPSVLLLSTALFLLASKNSGPGHSSLVSAQVSVPGRFPANFAGSLYRDIPLHTLDHHTGAEYDGFVDSNKMQGPPPTLRLPHLDNAQLLNEEEMSRRQLVEQGQEPDGAYQFGKAISVGSFDNESTFSKGRWIPSKSLRHQRFMDPREDEEDVLVWQLEIHSKSALSLNLIFSDLYLVPGAEFYVSGKRHILGAFTAEINNKPDGVFATAPIAGDRILLEYYTTRNALQRGMIPRIQLSHVVHGYKPTLLASSSDLTAKGSRRQDGSIVPRRKTRTGFKDQSSANILGAWNVEGDDEMPPVRAMSGKCNVDVACHQYEYQDQSRSVGVILTDYNQKYCSGAMVNNARQDGRQLFLTANHCAGFADTSAHVVMFNHEKIQCGPNSEVVNEHDTAMGLVKLANYAPSDFTLYEIVEPIPDAYNLYLSGWSALPKAPSSRPRETEQGPSSHWRNSRSSHKSPMGHTDDPSTDPEPEDPSTSRIPIVGIHHPSGDSKKISFFYNGTLPKTCWNECELHEFYHWQIPRWDRGTTEPGSSGSPLFDADKRIVGQLHGGSASCWNTNGYDVYGAIHASFTTPPKIKNRLATYLDPEGSGTKFMDGYSLEVARRETREQQGDNRERAPVEELVGPLGFPSLEKPYFVPKEEVPVSRHGSRHPGETLELTPDMFERMSILFDRIWQRLDLEGTD
ncbi:hypothetical protein EDD21DRAFT_411091 [Dissophora ornata]|nr:hypothetical protein BGZ58_005524 [Dissophora ornata]KAI8605455.1 hypothetical protein EDD21DRAFT_411091 [Dissophora ornata]